jgi:hypothetical protein
MEEVEVAVIETREEWEALKASELAKLGLTYEELAEQARTEDFSSHAARWIWGVFGGR